MQPWKLLVAALGEANWVLERPFGCGLQISSAAEFFEFRVCWEEFSPLWNMGQVLPCPSLCLMGCPEGVPDVFGMDVEIPTPECP